MKTIGDNFFPESLLNTMAELNKLQLSASALAIKATWPTISNHCFDGISAALKESAAASKRFSELTIQTKALTSWVNTISAVQVGAVSNVVAAVLPQVELAMCSALKDAAAMAAVVKADWSWIAELSVQEEEEGVDLGGEELVTPEVRAEITEDIAQVLSFPEQAEEISYSKCEKWAKKHPDLADLFKKVLLSLLAKLIVWGIVTGFKWAIASVTKDTRIYTEPSSKSSVVVNIAIAQDVTIIGDVPYFYEVEVPNPETGELVTGYVYKGNLTIREEEGDAPVEGENPIPVAPTERPADSLEAVENLSE